MTAPRHSPFSRPLRAVTDDAPAGLWSAWRHEAFVLAYALAWFTTLLLARRGYAHALDIANISYFGLGVVTPWAMLRAAAHPALDSQTRRAWRLQALSAATITVSGALWTAYLLMNPGAETPPWSFQITALYQPIAVVAFLCFPADPRIRLSDRRVAFDAALLALGGAALSWFFVFRPILTSAVQVDLTFDFVSSTMGWLVVAGASVAYIRSSNMTTRLAIAISLAAQVLFVLSDYSWGAAAREYHPGDWVDAAYFGAWLLRWASARLAWHGAGREPKIGVPYRSGVAPAAFVALAYVMLVLNVLTQRFDFGSTVLIAVLVTLMTWLLVARQAVELAETRRQSQAIEAQKERFRSVVDRVRDYVLVLDGDGRVGWSSPSVHRVHAVENAARLSDLVHRDDDAALRRWLPDGARPLGSQSVLVRLRRRDGGWEHVELRGTDARTDAHVAGIIVNGRVRTAELALEGRVRHAEKLATLHEMAGRIAHAFNNALMVVKGHAELLATDPAVTGDAAGEVADITRAAARGAAITRQLLGFSGRQVIQPEALDPSAVVEEMLPTWRRLLPPGTTVRRHGGADGGRILMDRAQFEQVLFNLVVNARDAMPEGGEILISVSRRDDGERRSVVIDVLDEGTGISDEHRARLFEPFFTTKAPGQGTGLGLAMVDTIVRRAGGEIVVQSVPGDGARFTVTLPAVTAPTVATRRDVGAELSAGAPSALPVKGVVLLVDDEDSVRNVTHRLLVRAGFTCVAVGSGAEALAVAEQGGIDLLVTDMMMPGMSGRELIAHFARRFPGTPIICVTGFTADGDARAPLPSQVQRVIEKPFESSDLIATVRRAIAR